MAKRRSRIPALNETQLQAALARVRQLTITPRAKARLSAMIQTAAQGGETVEGAIASVSPSRQDEIRQLAEAIQTQAQAVARRGDEQIEQNDESEAEETALVTLLLSAFRMRARDVTVLSELLHTSRVRMWVYAIEQEARAFGVTVQGRRPSGGDAALLRQASRQEATGIIATYNRDLKRQVSKIRLNGVTSLRVAAAQIGGWIVARAVWKARQIALTVNADAVQFARRMFHTRNISTPLQFIFEGPPTVCEDCLARFAAGVVDEAYANAFPCPRHPGCPHWWEVVDKATLRGEVWAG